MTKEERIQNYINGVKEFVKGYKKCKTFEERMYYLEDEDEYHLNSIGTRMIDDGLFENEEQIQKMLDDNNIEQEYYYFTPLW